MARQKILDHPEMHSGHCCQPGRVQVTGNHRDAKLFDLGLFSGLLLLCVTHSIWAVAPYVGDNTAVLLAQDFSASHLLVLLQTVQVGSPKPKSQFKPLSQSDEAIGRRLGELRRWLNLTQAELAETLAVTRNQIANLEARRVPLKFWFGWNLCSTLNVSQLWLATGEYPNRPFLNVDPTHVGRFKIGDDLLFGYLCSESGLRSQLQAAFIDREKSIIDVPGERKSSVVGSPHYTEELALSYANLYLTHYPKCRRAGKFDALMDDLREMYAVYHRIVGDNATNADKDILDSKTKADIIPGMSSEVPTWKQLKKAIAQLTAKRGQKAALAIELGVSRQVLGNWLSDDDQGAPNATLTLRLLKWVRDPKRKAK